jgi:hypothetical protein
MATVELSQGLMNVVVPLLFQPGFQTGGSGYDSSTDNAYFPFFPSAPIYGNYSGIYIMKGTKPTSFAGLTSYSVGAADVLVGFNANSTFGGASYTGNKFTLSTSNYAATASGTATWFWAIGTRQANPNVDTTPIIQQFIGTVGLSGSGADLTISDINIISGEVYRIASLVITVPPTYTV